MNLQTKPQHTRKSAVAVSKPLNPLLALHSLLKEDLQAVDQIINQRLHSPVPLISKVGYHLIQAGGKRLRPLLTIACNRLAGGTTQHALLLAAAVEFIHTATLLHDDVIDDSSLRRGQPTVNERWGNQTSVLVGDFLFARSFQLMTEEGSMAVLTILANAAATIAEGEILQLSACKSGMIDQETSLKIMAAKTAELFASACQVGTLSAVLHNRTGVEEDFSLNLRAYGYNLGMVFQIIDDILDYTANTQTLGKKVGDDFREGKMTLPVGIAYENSTSEQRLFWQRIFRERHYQKDDFIMALDIMTRGGAIQKAHDTAASFAVQARSALEGLPAQPLKQHLYDLVDYCLQRQS